MNVLKWYFKLHGVNLPSKEEKPITNEDDEETSDDTPIIKE